MIKAVDLRGSVSLHAGHGAELVPVATIALTLTEARHVREEPGGTTVRTEWLTREENYPVDISAIDAAIDHLTDLRQRYHALAERARQLAPLASPQDGN